MHVCACMCHNAILHIAIHSVSVQHNTSLKNVIILAPSSLLVGLKLVYVFDCVMLAHMAAMSTILKTGLPGNFIN